IVVRFSKILTLNYITIFFCKRSINFDAVNMLCHLASKEQKILMPVTNSGYGIGESGKFCTEDTPLRPISLVSNEW
ncbi:hypothetical protein, partial [Nostoc sp. JL31]|uniref:hypothetical protein n=1 Tax=Nostoc sp. JL31 TaxID=2815395 RepID=UPI0025F5A426